MHAGEVLQSKGNAVVSVAPEASVREALLMLNNCRIGSLIVLDAAGAIQGIITERDILRHVASTRGELSDIAVHDIMTPGGRVLVGTVDDDVNYLLTVMTHNRIRHLPILANGRLAGILSLGDLVKSQLVEADYENKLLRDFIEGSYPV